MLIYSHGCGFSLSKRAFWSDPEVPSLRLPPQSLGFPARLQLFTSYPLGHFHPCLLHKARTATPLLWGPRRLPPSPADVYRET